MHSEIVIRSHESPGAALHKINGAQREVGRVPAEASQKKKMIPRGTGRVHGDAEIDDLAPVLW